MNTLHQHSTKRIKTITTISCALGVALFTSSVFAVQTQGFWEASVIRGVTINANGTPMQQADPATNPDRFCELQGNNKRLPEIADFNIAYLNKVPLSGNNNSTNGDYSTRRSGSLATEWGGKLSVYSGAGWIIDNYWVKEPISIGVRHIVTLDGRGGLGSPVAEAFHSVACVRTL
ncbi:hypothetical protein [Thorsellia anophelis]|uniref:Uncharacterized protein n=1 Tax=Thorsellia anophelis DSM 18579 TaxID=1123402 RepID=A0A1H9YFQ9_9GAMM|nr:hypothetical protein [Thorsellia anophelis]SES67836.1 hypothetical protein SAMN02583745_00240 [Thorsellia anophelis DSM 18579]